MLTHKGHKVSCIVQEGPASDDIVPSHVCNWANFEHEVIEAFDPDLIIVWNGYFNYFYAAVSILKKKYPVATMEMGWYQRATHSYIMGDLAHYAPICNLEFKPWALSFKRNRDLLDETRFRYDATLPTSDIPEDYIFMPMQLEHDTQILYCSPHFKSMDSAIGFVKNEVPEARIVVRNHPLEESPKRPEGVLDLTQVSPSLPLAVAATLVCGINSTLLAEAMLFHKPIIALGKHVSGAAFLDPANIRAIYQYLRDGRFEEACGKSYRERCDFWALALLKNQWDCKSPPGWVIDCIEKRAFSPVFP